MATRFIDKVASANSSNTANLPDAAGLTYDVSSNSVKVNGNGTVSEIVSSAQTVLAASGAVPVVSGTKIITAGSAAALTLAVPTVDGTEIRFISTTAFAHTITAPSNLFWEGVTGGPFDVITLGAFPGAGVTLVSRTGLWYVVAKTVAVLS